MNVVNWSKLRRVLILPCVCVEEGTKYIIYISKLCKVLCAQANVMKRGKREREKKQKTAWTKPDLRFISNNRESLVLAGEGRRVKSTACLRERSQRFSSVNVIILYPFGQVIFPFSLSLLVERALVRSFFTIYKNSFIEKGGKKSK